MAVPIRVVGENGATMPGMVATFFWLDPSGGIAKVVEQAPIDNGIALYSGLPLPHGAFFGVTVHAASGPPVFRSGRLAKLPGPPSNILATSRINVFHSTTPVGFGLNSPDGAPDLMRQRLLATLPSSLRIEEVKLGADNEGREVVTIKGRVKRFGFLWLPFSYTLVLVLRVASQPGHPENAILVEPAGPGTTTGASLGSLSVTLDRAIVEGVKHALELAIRRIAALQHERFGLDFPASMVSLTSLTLRPFLSDPTIEMQVHGGVISGVRDTVARDASA